MPNIKAYFENEQNSSYDIDNTIRNLSLQISYQKDLISNLENYTNYLTSLIKLSKEYNIEVIKLAKLIKYEKVRNVNCAFADDYLNIFLDSIENDEKRYSSFFNEND